MGAPNRKGWMMDAATTSISPAMVDDLVSRVVRCVAPSRIIVFGSAARGEVGPNSDLDILVIVPDGTHRSETARKLCHALWDLGIPKDVVVATESDVEEFGEEPSLVIHPALKEGKEIYRAS
jgi:predicted nucleotidyltransferase